MSGGGTQHVKAAKSDAHGRASAAGEAVLSAHTANVRPSTSSALAQRARMGVLLWSSKLGRKTPAPPNYATSVPVGTVPSHTARYYCSLVNAIFKFGSPPKEAQPRRLENHAVRDVAAGRRTRARNLNDLRAAANKPGE